MAGEAFNLVARGGLAWLESLALNRLPWLLHAFSTRQGGVSRRPCAGLNLGFTASDYRERVEQNRHCFLQQIGAQDFVPVSLRQVHSSQSLVVTHAGAGQLALASPDAARSQALTANPPPGDGLMTAEPGLLLTIRIADCLPVLLVDPQRRVVAAVHAGWRGALARVIAKAVADMRTAFGSDPQQLIAALGPSVRACCYEVGEEVVQSFRESFADAAKFFRALHHRPEEPTDRHSIFLFADCRPGHAPERVPAARLDLLAVAQDQLAGAGVKPANVWVADYCTACRSDLFFSYRKEGAATGRQAAVIGIRRAVDSEQ